MAAPQNHWKLGLFVVAGFVMALSAVALLGARSMHKDVGLYVSYFDESVQGLEVGSPIKFRGVTIGTVSGIQVAPDHRHVEVESALGVKELARLGLDVAKGPVRSDVPRKLEMTADLRLQLASAGLTGVKFLQLDFFDVALYPPPELPFLVPENYIPTAPSMIKNLEDSLTRMIGHLTEISDQTASIMGEIEVIVREVNEREIPGRIADALARMNGLLAAAQMKVTQVDSQGLSRSAKKTLDDVSAAAGRLDVILARIDRDDGLLTSVERASGAIGDTLRDADGLGGQLAETMVSVRASARSIRKFVEALEQDPDMLLKGRSPERKP